MRQSSAALLVLVVLSCTIACARAADGFALAKNWCNACHVISKGDTSFDDGEVAPPFSDMKTIDATNLAALLRKGHGDTPALSKLTPAEVKALAEHIARQARN